MQLINGPSQLVDWLSTDNLEADSIDSNTNWSALRFCVV